MKILLVEPFFSGSHQSWAEAYQKFSGHEIRILSLKGRHWKWRMFGGAVSLAKQFLNLDFIPDLLLVTDMLDLPTFLGLTRSRTSQLEVVIYFHENQISYPWSPDDPDIALKRNNQYGFINYTSALAASRVFFNSAYHKKVFLDSLPKFLKQFPDHRELANIEKIRLKSSVLYLGLSLKRFLKHQSIIKRQVTVLLWNHRWEYDKNPNDFFQALFRLQEEQIDFRLIVLGDSYQKQPPIFNSAKEKLKEKLLHWGFVDNFENYAKWLWMADIVPVTSKQDFFGGSVVEAIYCNCIPVLPERLAYTEHIPQQWKSTVFYPNKDSFYVKLKNAILNSKTYSFNTDLQNFVARYDWSTLAPHYDQVFENIY